MLCAASPLLLTGCSGKGWLRPAPEPAKIVKQYPPDAYLQDCPAPVYQPGLAWSALAQYAAALQTTRDCDRCDKVRLRAWRDGKPEPKCENR